MKIKVLLVVLYIILSLGESFAQQSDPDLLAAKQALNDEKYSDAVVSFEKAIKKGNREAMLMYSYYLIASGTTGKSEYPKAEQLMLEAAKIGTAEVYHTIGYLYDMAGMIAFPSKAPKIDDEEYLYLGRTEEEKTRDETLDQYVKAANWWGKAAALGQAYSMFELGQSYLYGKGVKQDDSKGNELIVKAANLGLIPAMLFIGSNAYNPEMRLVDYKTAIVWYTKAAELNSKDAMRSLSRLYSKEKQLDPEGKLAAKWLEKSKTATGN